MPLQGGLSIERMLPFGAEKSSRAGILSLCFPGGWSTEEELTLRSADSQEIVLEHIGGGTAMLGQVAGRIAAAEGMIANHQTEVDTNYA